MVEDSDEYDEDVAGSQDNDTDVVEVEAAEEPSSTPADQSSENDAANDEGPKPDFDQEVELVEIVGEKIDAERAGTVRSGGGCDATGHSDGASWPALALFFGLGVLGRRRRQ